MSRALLGFCSSCHCWFSTLPEFLSKVAFLSAAYRTCVELGLSVGVGRDLQARLLPPELICCGLSLAACLPLL